MYISFNFASFTTSLLQIFSFCVIYSSNFVFGINKDWDLNFACREDLKRLADKQAQMARCAVENSAPPQVCTSCYIQYAQLREEEYKSQHLDVLSANNRTCTTVIYENYVVSYAHLMSGALEKQIWEKSRCQSCLIIHGDLTNGTATFDLDNKTSTFSKLLNVWRDCISNATFILKNIQNNNKNTGLQTYKRQEDPPFVCQHCSKQFDSLFDFYWKVYTAPNIDFCVDVEAMMNDTMNLWHDVLHCKDDPRTEDRHQDIRVAAFSAALLAIVIGLFYAGSYIQTEQAQTQLIQYSRRQTVHDVQRSRLLSSSTLDAYADPTPGSSMQG
uniref:Uncharacterized protein n=1 Tax=Meloidogyne enterolobii TaxID=390850 RepID=A0A6V7WDV7_MELEN|nr:unnamed protein product [Meloidogyne enterolobii]